MLSDIYLLIQTLGFAIEVILFGLLNVLVWRAERLSGEPHWGLLAAVAGLVWNLGALAVYLSSLFGFDSTWLFFRLAHTFAYAATAVLPTPFVMGTQPIRWARPWQPRDALAALFFLRECHLADIGDFHHCHCAQLPDWRFHLQAAFGLQPDAPCGCWRGCVLRHCGTNASRAHFFAHDGAARRGSGSVPVDIDPSSGRSPFQNCAQRAGSTIEHSRCNRGSGFAGAISLR